MDRKIELQEEKTWGNWLKFIFRLLLKFIENTRQKVQLNSPKNIIVMYMIVLMKSFNQRKKSCIFILLLNHNSIHLRELKDEILLMKRGLVSENLRESLGQNLLGYLIRGNEGIPTSLVISSACAINYVFRGKQQVVE
jgi:hypothetical protein